MQTTLDPEGVLEDWPDGLVVIDVPDRAIARANERAATLLGRSREALRGASPSALAPDDWTPDRPVEALFDLARGERVGFRWRVDRPDGTAVELDCSMRRPDDAEEYAVVSLRAASPERAADDGGPDTDTVREVVDGIADPVTVVDPDGTYVAANRAAVERLGYSRSALRGMEPGDVHHPDHAERVEEQVRAVEDGGGRTIESVWVTAAGEEIPVEVAPRRITVRGEPVVVCVVRDISARKERLRRLRTFERAVEHAGHAVYITDTDGTIRYVNPAFEEVTGYDATEAVGETPAILESGVEDEDYYRRLWETILDGEVWEERIENERADGERYTAEQTIAPIVEDGEVVAFVAVQRDVTERREHERELERYRDLIDNIPVGVYRNEPGVAGEFTAVNPAMLELFDADSEAELLGTPVAELYRSPGRREIVSRKLDTEGHIEEEELRLETLSGEPFWGAVSAIRHEIDGEVYYDGIVQDVTERHEATRELRLREQRFRRLFEDHNAPMLLVDPDDGAIERANDAAAAFYGYDRETLTAMDVQDINRLPDEEIARRREQAETGETNRFIFPHELADGEVRRVEVDSTPIHTGEKRLLFSIIHDVTERERTRDRIERQNDQLEVLNRVVRHDIRNDMTVVLSHAEFLADHVDAAGREYLDTLVEHGEHVVELTETVRALMERMLADDPGDPGDVWLANVLEDEIEAARDGYESATFTLEGSVPNVRVAGNEMLSSVFRNLLNNAVQHNDAETPTVTVSATADDDSVEIRVEDDGPGVPDDRKDEIFGKGERGIDSPGTGLGLYLVHTFVEQFGGDVWVTDAEPRGSVFHVELPRAD
ncbi:MAG: PAS domain S-box protein [Halorientalis sp.]